MDPSNFFGFLNVRPFSPRALQRFLYISGYCDPWCAGHRLIRKKPLSFLKLEEKCEKCLIDEAGSVHFPQVCPDTKVIHQRVLSSGRVQTNLWYKGLRVISTTCWCYNFSLIQLETKTTFYKQCWPYVLIGSVRYLQTVFFSMPFNKLPIGLRLPPNFDDISTSNSAWPWLLYGIHT